MFFKKAILMIHGFAGGTYDIEDLANFYSVKNDTFALLKKNKPDIIIMEKSYPTIFSILSRAFSYGSTYVS